MIIKSSATRSKVVADLWDFRRIFHFNVCVTKIYTIIMIQGGLIIADSKTDGCFHALPFNDSASFGNFAVNALIYVLKTLSDKATLLKCFLSLTLS